MDSACGNDPVGNGRQLSPAPKRARVLDRGSFQNALVRLSCSADPSSNSDCIARKNICVMNDDGDQADEEIDSGCSTQDGTHSQSSTGVKRGEDEAIMVSDVDDDNSQKKSEVKGGWEELRSEMKTRHQTKYQGVNEKDLPESIEDYDSQIRMESKTVVDTMRAVGFSLAKDAAEKSDDVLVASTQDNSEKENNVSCADTEEDSIGDDAVIKKRNESSIGDILDDSSSCDSVHGYQIGQLPNQSMNQPSLCDTLRSLQMSVNPKCQSPMQNNSWFRNPPLSAATSNWLHDLDVGKITDTSSSSGEQVGRRSMAKFIPGGLAQRFNQLEFQPKTFRSQSQSNRTHPVKVIIAKEHNPRMQGPFFCCLCWIVEDTSDGNNCNPAFKKGEFVDVFLQSNIIVSDDKSKDHIDETFNKLKSGIIVIHSWYPVNTNNFSCIICTKYTIVSLQEKMPLLPNVISDTPLSLIVGTERRAFSDIVRFSCEMGAALNGVIQSFRSCSYLSCETWRRPGLNVTIWLFTGVFCNVIVPKELLDLTEVATLKHLGSVLSLRGIHRIGCRPVTAKEKKAFARFASHYPSSSISCFEVTPGSFSVSTISLPCSARSYFVGCHELTSDWVVHSTDADQSNNGDRLKVTGVLLSVSLNHLILALGNAKSRDPLVVAIEVPIPIAKRLRENSLGATVVLNDIFCDGHKKLVYDEYSSVVAQTESVESYDPDILWLPRTSIPFALTHSYWPPIRQSDALFTIQSSRVLSLNGSVIRSRRVNNNSPLCPQCLRRLIDFGDGFACEHCGILVEQGFVTTEMNICIEQDHPDPSLILPPIIVRILGIPESTEITIRNRAEGICCVVTLDKLPKIANVVQMPVIITSVSDTLIEADFVNIKQDFY